MAKLVLVDDEPSTQKSYRLVPVDDAPQKPIGVRLNDAISDIPRQLGLTARYGVEGVASIPAMLANAPAALYNKAADAVQGDGNGYRFPEQSGNVSSLLDKIGLPRPANATERVVGDVSRAVAGTGGLLKAAQATAPLLTGTSKAVATNLESNPLQQLVGAGTGAAAGGKVRETGGNAGSQFAASLLGGLAGAGATSLAQKGAAAVQRVVNRPPAVDNATVDITLNNILSDGGVPLSQVAPSVRAQMSAEVQRALQAGQQVNPAVIRRLADYSAVGATPTRGTVTLDPVLVTQEKNLAKIGANSKDPRLQQLAQNQYQNNATLIDGLNKLGASGIDPLTAGQRVMGAVENRLGASKAVQSGLYQQARDAAGRDVPLDRSAFVNQAFDNLAKSNKGAFLPGEIETMLNQISGGVVTRGGKQYPVPFDVNTIDSLKTTLANASRGAKDGNVRAAIADVRNALENTPLSSSNATATGSTLPVSPQLGAALNAAGNEVPQQAMDAFNLARRHTRAMNSWLDSSQGLRAVADGVEPDKFVQQYIIGQGDKANFADVKNLFNTIRRDPQAMDAARQSVMTFLKGKALNGAADEVGNFSPSAYNKALQQIGDFKLRLMFNSDELAQMKAIGRVGSYETFQPRGSAVNNSNTAAGIAGLVERIADSPLVSKIPFGRQMIAEPGANIAASLRIKQAMNPASAIAMPQQVTANPKSVPIWMLPGLLAPQQGN